MCTFKKSLSFWVVTQNRTSRNRMSRSSHIAGRCYSSPSFRLCCSPYTISEVLPLSSLRYAMPIQLRDRYTGTIYSVTTDNKFCLQILNLNIHGGSHANLGINWQPAWSWASLRSFHWGPGALLKFWNSLHTGISTSWIPTFTRQAPGSPFPVYDCCQHAKRVTFQFWKHWCLRIQRCQRQLSS